MLLQLLDLVFFRFSYISNNTLNKQFENSYKPEDLVDEADYNVYILSYSKNILVCLYLIRPRVFFKSISYF